MNVSMWVGHRAYIECSTTATAISLLDRSPLLRRRPAAGDAERAAGQLLADEPLDSAESWPANCASCSTRSSTQWRDGKLDDQTEDASRAALVNATAGERPVHAAACRSRTAAETPGRWRS